MSAFCIEIKKYKESDGKIIYQINDVFNRDIFYASIEPHKKIINFYETNNFNDLVMVIDYSDLQKQLGKKIKGHNEQTIVRVFINLYKAAQKNEFPDDLSYYA